MYFEKNLLPASVNAAYADCVEFREYNVSYELSATNKTV